jgi:hypothetical protein
MDLAVANGVDVTVYDNVNIVTNNDLDCCAWGGGFTYGGKFYGATWEPPWGQEVGVYAHEMSHSLGLPHSGWLYFAYDSPWDIMSMIMDASVVQCGSYNSINDGGTTEPLYCTEPGNGHITPHKDYLGWIPNANKVVINSISTTTVVLESSARPLGTRAKLIKICLNGKPCTGSNAHFLTVEARMTGYPFDDGLPGNGVIIHDVRMNRGPISGSCYFNSQSGWAVPADATRNDFNPTTCTPKTQCTPGANFALCNAAYKVGMRYRNNAYGIVVNVLSSTSSTFRVRVVRSQ